MHITKANVLDMFKHILVVEGEVETGMSTPAYALNMDGEPRADEKDYVLVPISEDITEDDLVDIAWDTLCASATDAHAVAKARGQFLPLMLSETELEINAEFICVFIEHSSGYGIAVFRKDDIPQDAGEVIPTDFTSENTE